MIMVGDVIQDMNHFDVEHSMMEFKKERKSEKEREREQRSASSAKKDTRNRILVVNVVTHTEQTSS